MRPHIPASALHKSWLTFHKSFEHFKTIHRPVFYFSRLSFLLLTSLAEPETAVYNALLGVFSGIGALLLGASVMDNFVGESRRKEAAAAVVDVLSTTDKKLLQLALMDSLVDYLLHLENIKPDAVETSKAAVKQAFMQSLQSVFQNDQRLFRPATLFSALFPHVMPCTLVRNQYINLVLTCVKRGLSSNALLQGVRYGAFPLSVAAIVLLFIPGAILSGPAGWVVLGLCIGFFVVAMGSQLVKNYKRDELNNRNELELQQLQVKEEILEERLCSSNLEKIMAQLDEKIAQLCSPTDAAKIAYLTRQKERLQRCFSEQQVLLEKSPLNEKPEENTPITYVDDEKKMPRDIYDVTSTTAIVEKKLPHIIYDYCTRFNEVVRPFYRSIAGAQVTVAALGAVEAAAVGFGIVGLFCLVSGWFSSKNEARIAEEGRWLSHKTATTRKRVEQLQKQYMEVQLTQHCIENLDNLCKTQEKPVLFSETSVDDPLVPKRLEVRAQLERSPPCMTLQRMP